MHTIKFLQATSLLSVFAFATLCSAAPITSISGTGGAGPGVATSPLIPFMGGAIQASTAPPAAQITYPPTPGSFSLGAFTLDLTNFTANPGNVNLTSPTLTITDNNTFQTAVFTVVGVNAPGILNHVSMMGFEFGGVNFLVQLTSDGIAALDLGPLGNFWDFTLSYNGISVVPGVTGSYTVPGGSSSSSFNLNSNFLLNGGTPVPEPASIIAWGIVVSAGFFLRRRVVSV